MKITDYIGEATAYDKKLMLERKEPLSWLKSISAFANTLGGKLLYGIRNDGEVVGLENAEKDAEDISEIIKNALDPIPEFELTFDQIEDKTILVVFVKPGQETPYYVFYKGHRDAYIRVGNESVKARAIDLKRLVLRGVKRSWDSQISTFKRDNYSFETLRAEYFTKTNIEFMENDFESFGLVASGGLLTNAGALLADKSPICQSRVFCTRWNGLDKSNGTMEALDDDEFSGGLLLLLERAKGFVRVNSKTRWRKAEDGSGRINYCDYPAAAVEEVIVNALIHRDYLELGSEVHIDMYDDRMEIYSPGGMPSGKLVQELDARSVPSKRRNPVIADLFQRLDLMERRGSGLGKILNAYKFESERRGREISPIFRSDATDFFVILPNLNYGDPVEESVQADSMGENIPLNGEKNLLVLSKSAKVILRALSTDGHTTILDLRRKTRLSHSGVYKILTALKEGQYIRRAGSARNGYWEVLKKELI